ncbi:MAG: ATP-binding protein [Candidatus Omnitrophota bacterium]
MDKFAKYPKEFVNKVIDEADVLVLFLEPDGQVSICNKKFESVIAKDCCDIVGQSWQGLFSPTEGNAIKLQMLRAVVDDSVKYKRPNNFEGVLIDKENNERLISWSITPILLDGSGDLTGVLLIGNDTTELREGETSFKKIDETMRNIFSNIKEYAIYVINLDGNITYFGMGSEIMLGWQKNEIIFKHVNLLHTPDDAASLLPKMLEQVNKEGLFETEISLIKKTGQSIPVNLTVNKFIDSEGKLMGYIFVAKDITETKKLEYQIFQAEKLAAIGQLAAGMAHEINNPLFVISGRLELMLLDEKLNEKIRQDLNTINAQADRIRKLVDQLLKFARKSPPKMETVNINEIIEAVLPLLSYHKLPASKNIEIDKDLAKGLPAIKGDANQLQEVFVNLLLNGMQAMPQGGRLSIGSREVEGRLIEVKISDTGCGISESNRKNIFMPFFSTKKDGTGLGLSICFNIIKNHNGVIDIESEVNKGTTFVIKLPIS